MEKKEKILEFTEEKLFSQGFHKTTMAEISSELRMSKKTIYKHFPSKHDLVSAIANRFTERMKGKILPILNSDENAVEKIIGLISLLSKTATKIGDKIFAELKTHFPTVWQQVDKFRTEMMYANLSKVIDQGKNEGLIEDYPTPLIMNILVNAVRSTVNPEFILNNNFSMKVAAQTTFKIIMKGILTEKGKKQFAKSMKEIEQ
jgi:AcrR family transcriptional regulator